METSVRPLVQPSLLVTERGLTLLSLTDNWNRSSHPMTVDTFGKWQIVIPPTSTGVAIPHDSKVKIHFKLADGSTGDRVPAWA